jgi:sucrose-6-phosphate hydrolase SacC (GH32 family)
MPFSQVMLFPTEFSLKSTTDGPRLRANPISEIANLHYQEYKLGSINFREANTKLEQIKPQPLHVKIEFTLDQGNTFKLYFQGSELVNLSSYELPRGKNTMEILIDRSVAEIFVNNGERYIVKYLRGEKPQDGLHFESDRYGPFINSMALYTLKSIWD